MCIPHFLRILMCKHISLLEMRSARFLRYFGIFGFRRIFQFFKHLICVSLFSYQCALSYSLVRSAALSDSFCILSHSVRTCQQLFFIFFKLFFGAQYAPDSVPAALRFCLSIIRVPHTKLLCLLVIHLRHFRSLSLLIIRVRHPESS